MRHVLALNAMVMQNRLPQTPSILQISPVMWKSSRMHGVRLEVFHDPDFGDAWQVTHGKFQYFDGGRS